MHHHAHGYLPGFNPPRQVPNISDYSQQVYELKSTLSRREYSTLPQTQLNSLRMRRLSNLISRLWPKWVKRNARKRLNSVQTNVSVFAKAVFSLSLSLSPYRKSVNASTIHVRMHARKQIQTNLVTQSRTHRTRDEAACVSCLPQCRICLRRIMCHLPRDSACQKRMERTASSVLSLLWSAYTNFCLGFDLFLSVSIMMWREWNKADVNDRPTKMVNECSIGHSKHSSNVKVPLDAWISLTNPRRPIFVEFY